ncbi:RNA polymerase sigma factor [Daejeonella lutea]|uniref:RNA polymerase sigma-70 factor, ECF subfamily n=1 Tax=Daejeonella lutea TaxID=572036 RepID=A0A1T5B3M7_9SPHI|nr:sigma-70 family RNA polymerase sigma factor [Daejeonella lutea]SKB41560.1 RNA polymerase sigma-70 factor, ECF subfamily [Daejeonella lutea]
MESNPQQELFISVIEENKGIIYKIANSFKKDEDDKKDLVQEIIFQLWRSFNTYDRSSKLSTWMYRVALNVAITSYRKDKKKTEVFVPLGDSMLEFADTDRYDETSLNLLQQFIRELKELDRALMILYLEEKSGKEMAEILGLSELNIRTKISRIKEQLKKKFSHINQ